MTQIVPQRGRQPLVSATAACRPPGRAPHPAPEAGKVSPLGNDGLQATLAKGHQPYVAPFTAPFVAVADATAVHRPLMPTALNRVAPLPKQASVGPFSIRNQLTESANNNACGTNALWMTMAFHLGADRVDFRDLDRQCRATGVDLGSSPDFLAAYARKHGLAASIHHESTTDDLRRLIAAGLPPIILTDWHADTKPGKSLHYLTVTGYSSTDDAKAVWTVANPWGGIVEKVDTPTLLKRWSHLALNPIKTPFNRMILALAPPSQRAALPSSNPSFGQAVALGAVDALTVGGKLYADLRHSVQTLSRALPPLVPMPGLPLSRF
jgi:hypothetical protein